MNAVVNKFLLAGDKFMPEMHLKQPEELLKPIIGKISKRKVHSPFIDNIWGVDQSSISNRYVIDK